MLYGKRISQFTHLVCALAIALGAASLASADLVLKGGNDRQQLAIDEIYANRIPAVWRTSHPIKVNILTDREMNAYIRAGSDQKMQSSDDDDTIDGIYEGGPPTITLRGNTDSESMPLTFAHEYGHFVWESELTRADRSRYIAIYQRQKRDHHLVTEYAATDVHEGFAEAFSYYVMARNSLLRRDEASCRFLDEVLQRASAAQPIPDR